MKGENPSPKPPTDIRQSYVQTYVVFKGVMLQHMTYFANTKNRT